MLKSFDWLSNGGVQGTIAWNLILQFLPQFDNLFPIWTSMQALELH
jgi:hypothetical protein